jgi:hypothetical protein
VRETTPYEGNKMSGFESSQAVPDRLSGRGRMRRQSVGERGR